VGGFVQHLIQIVPAQRGLRRHVVTGIQSLFKLGLALDIVIGIAAPVAVRMFGINSLEARLPSPDQIWLEARLMCHGLDGVRRLHFYSADMEKNLPMSTLCLIFVKL
jgi:hypothetical protein